MGYFPPTWGVFSPPFYREARWGFKADRPAISAGASRADPDLDELALRVAGRYLPGRTLVPAELKAWVEENRKWLFFTDVGGFKWVVDEHAKKDAAK